MKTVRFSSFIGVGTNLLMMISSFVFKGRYKKEQYTFIPLVDVDRSKFDFDLDEPNMNLETNQLLQIVAYYIKKEQTYSKSSAPGYSFYYYTRLWCSMIQFMLIFFLGMAWVFRW